MRPQIDLLIVVLLRASHFGCSAAAGRQTPSPPPAARPARAPPPLTFSHMAGFLPAGNDLLVASLSFDEAEVKCRALESCAGFTFNCTSAEGDAVIHIPTI